MKKLLIVLVCTLTTGLVLCKSALSQMDSGDVWHPPQAASDWNRDGNSHVVPIEAISVPGTSEANPFVNFDQARVDTRTQLLFVSSRSSKAVAIFDALTDRKVGDTPAIFAGVGIAVLTLARTGALSPVATSLQETSRARLECLTSVQVFLRLPKFPKSKQAACFELTRWTMIRSITLLSLPTAIQRRPSLL